MTDVVKKLLLLCNEPEAKYDRTIYRGFIGHDYLGFSRYLSKDFNYFPEWSNGYREVYYSHKDLCSVTTCEGDLMIVLFKDEAALERDLKQAHIFYANH